MFNTIWIGFSVIVVARTGIHYFDACHATACAMLILDLRSLDTRAIGFGFGRDRTKVINLCYLRFTLLHRQDETSRIPGRPSNDNAGRKATSHDAALNADGQHAGWVLS